MGEHTPAPWRIAELNLQGMYANDGSITILGPEDAVATVLVQTPLKRGEGYRAACAVRDANAHLIAAAPDLRDALDPVTLELAADTCEKAALFGVARELRTKAAKERAAIAKAQGAQP